MDFVEALKIANAVFEKYRQDQPKWWKRMDHTPILNDVAVRMAEAFLAAQPRQGWQPIETAPKDGTRFLGLESVPVHNEDTGVSKIETNMCVCYHFAMFGIIPYPYTGKIVQGQEITHWMPLPEPPGRT